MVNFQPKIFSLKFSVLVVMQDFIQILRLCSHNDNSKTG